MAAVAHAAPHPISRADDEAFIAAQVKLVRDPLAVAVGVRRQQHAFRWPNLLELHAERLASQVERDGDPAFGVLAPIEQQVALRSERPIGAIRQRPTGTAKPDQPAVEVEDRGRIGALALDILPAEVRA
jgi:hypothetical protein